MDLISRQAAIDAVKHAWAKGLEPTQYIEDIPSAQLDRDIPKKPNKTTDRCSITDEQVETMGVENPDMLQKLRCAELIQCADCKNADFSAHNHGTCYCMEHSCYMHEDDFCSRGVRDSV